MMFAVLEYRIARALERIGILEARLDALLAVVPHDILIAAKAARAHGLNLVGMRRRRATPEHGSEINGLFLHLRREGWSIDRIARATGYTSRGVTANLRRYSCGSS